MFSWMRRRRRARAMAQPLPPHHEAVLRTLPLHDMLPDGDHAQWRGLINAFLAEKRFEGCRGLEVTDEMRVVVAAQACLLLLRRAHDLFPALDVILLYPTAYLAQHVEVDDIGIHAHREDVMLGESWERGNVVLSWEDVDIDAANPDDGFNVTLHEFAHQLDAENGAMDGAPELPRELRAEWARVMKTEYEALCVVADSLPDEPAEDELDPAFGERRARPEADFVLDPYGAEDPAEFFAVATEAFFEDARRLRARHPEVYRMLAACYGQNPASWPAPHRPRRLGSADTPQAMGG